MAQAGKRELSLKRLLARPAVAKNSEVANRYLLSLLNISQCMDSVPLTIVVPEFLGVVVTQVLNTTCIEKDAPFCRIISKYKSVRSDNYKILRGNTIHVNVTQREEGSPLV